MDSKRMSKKKMTQIPAPTSRTTRSETREDLARNHQQQQDTSTKVKLIRTKGEQKEFQSNSQVSTETWTNSDLVNDSSSINVVAEEVVLNLRGRPIRTAKRLSYDERKGLDKKNTSIGGLRDAGRSSELNLNMENFSDSDLPSQVIAIKSEPEPVFLQEYEETVETTAAPIANIMDKDSDDDQVETRTRSKRKSRADDVKKSKVKVSKHRSVENTPSPSTSRASFLNKAKKPSQRSSSKGSASVVPVASRKKSNKKLLRESALVKTDGNRSPSITSARLGPGRPKNLKKLNKSASMIDSTETSKKQNSKKAKESKSKSYPSQSEKFIGKTETKKERGSTHNRPLQQGNTKLLTYYPSSSQRPIVIGENWPSQSSKYIHTCRSLRNLLRLPKAHKWVVYEFFYSDIDRAIFFGDNDFEVCVRELVPKLKTRKLTQPQWNWVRTTMGKPRRLSPAFLEQERTQLHEKRTRIRFIQQKKLKSATLLSFTSKDVPETIPLLLPIGTRVTARLRKPQDGLFLATVNGIDKSNNTYRITFDRPDLGTFSVPDYEVQANGPVETVPAWSYFFTATENTYRRISHDSVLNQLTTPISSNNTFGSGHPIRLLVIIIRISKLLKTKREKLYELKEFNTEAEKLRAYGKSFDKDDVLEYAKVVVNLQSINKNLTEFFETVQLSFREIFTSNLSPMINPDEIKEQARTDTATIVEKRNFIKRRGRNRVTGKHAVDLITNLTALMTQQMRLTVMSAGRGLYESEVKGLTDAVKEAKASLIEGRNVKLFQNRVEIPMKRIEIGLCIPYHDDKSKENERPNYDNYDA